MVTEPTHIEEGIFDLVLTYVSDIVGDRIGSPVGSSDYSAIFIDIVLEQPIPHLACKPGWAALLLTVAALSLPLLA